MNPPAYRPGLCYYSLNGFCVIEKSQSLWSPGTNILIMLLWPLSCLKCIICFTFSLPAFYRNVLVFLPFAASALILTMLVVMLLLEWRQKRHRPSPEQALTPSVHHGDMQTPGETERMLYESYSQNYCKWSYICFIQRHTFSPFQEGCAHTDKLAIKWEEFLVGSTEFVNLAI